MGVIVVLLAGIVYLLLPRRTTDIVVIGDEQSWNEREAPLRRQIIWKPAVPVEPPAVAEARGSFIRPQLAEHGTVLYFTLRKPKADLDIYRARLVNGKWQEAQPVEELNTEFDDVGPIIQAGEKRLYLYSNRGGGFGGSDLYVSQRTEEGWSEPVNLGPQINSPADEFDPAVSADGTRLFYESNRSPEVHQKIVDNKAVDQGDPWKTTLRAHRKNETFDIYMARRGSPDEKWEVSSPLDELNQPNTDEGSPYVDPTGAFLYFASDRVSGRPMLRKDYDIYRARIRNDRVTDIENLGPGVNTEKNEFEPTLSAEGFRLFFSRDVKPEPGQSALEDTYALFSSDAAEVEEEAAWEGGPWRAIAGFFARNGLWLLLFLIVAMLILILGWLLYMIYRRRIVVPAIVVCLLIAMFVHLMGGAGSFFVFFSDAIVARIKKEFREIAVATHLSSEDEHQSHKRGKERYEKVADLKSIETEKIHDVQRQVTEMPNVPIPIDSPAPALPMELVRDTADDRPFVTLPQSEIEPKKTPNFTRRRVEVEMLEEERIEMEKIEAARREMERKVASMVVDLKTRHESPQAPDAPQPLRRRPIDPAIELTHDEVKAEPTHANPVQPFITKAPKKIDRAVRAPADAPDAPRVTRDDVAAPAAPDLPDRPPVREEVGVGRAAPAASPAAPTGPIRRAAPSDAAMQLAEAKIPIEPVVGNPAAPAVDRRPKKIDRSARTPVAPTAPPTIKKVSVDAAVPTTKGERQPERETVDVQRGTPTTPAEVPKPLRRAASANAPIKAAMIPANVPVPRGADVPVSPASDLKPAKIDRAARTPVKPSTAATSDQVVPESFQGPDAAESGSTARGQPGRVEVTVGRQKTASQAGAPEMVPRKGSTNVVAGAGRPAESLDPIARIGSPAGPEPTKVAARPARANTGRSVAGEAEAEPIAPEQSLSGGGATGPARKVEGVEVGHKRPGAQLIKAPNHSARQAGGYHNPDNPRLTIGPLAKVEVDAPLSISPVGSRLLKRRARAPSILYADDRVGIEQMLMRRQVSEEEKRDLVIKFGGDDETLKAVKRGLVWISQHQHPDGHWSLNKFHEQCKGHKCNGQGKENSDTAATGLALLPMLGDGHTHQTGKYKQNVDKGLNWLIGRQKPNGDLYTGGGGNAHMYSHGLASIALCEAYGMSKDPKLREPAQKAVDFIVYAQHDAGGWRYNPKQAGDTSVFGWQIMALKSAQMSQLNVPAETLKKADKWLAAQNFEPGRFGYQGRNGPHPAMTAEGLLCVQYLGANRNDPRLQAGAKYMLKHLPQKNKDNSYYWYYGTQVMYHMQGDDWKQWNDAMKDTLLGTQVVSGPMTGSWKPRDNWENSGGRLYATSLKVLMLEIYWRHLPLYEVLKP